MCGRECLENEECRHDKENCEYKCYVLSKDATSSQNATSSQKISASIGAVAGALLIGLLIFFVVRHFRKKAQLKNTINEQKQLDYEVPYQYNESYEVPYQNESVNAHGKENEEIYEAYESAEYETYHDRYAEYNKKNGR